MTEIRKDALIAGLEICHDENRDPWQRLAEIETLNARTIKESKHSVEVEIPHVSKRGYCSGKCPLITYASTCCGDFQQEKSIIPGPQCPRYQGEKGKEYVTQGT